MLSWSPISTTGDRSGTDASNGYQDDTTRLRGFALTHVNGPGASRWRPVTCCSAGTPTGVAEPELNGCRGLGCDGMEDVRGSNPLSSTSTPLDTVISHSSRSCGVRPRAEPGSRTDSRSHPNVLLEGRVHRAGTLGQHRTQLLAVDLLGGPPARVPHQLGDVPDLHARVRERRDQRCPSSRVVRVSHPGPPPEQLHGRTGGRPLHPAPCPRGAGEPDPVSGDRPPTALLAAAGGECGDRLAHSPGVRGCSAMLMSSSRCRGALDATHLGRGRSATPRSSPFHSLLAVPLPGDQEALELGVLGARRRGPCAWTKPAPPVQRRGAGRPGCGSASAGPVVVGPT